MKKCANSLLESRNGGAADKRMDERGAQISVSIKELEYLDVASSEFDPLPGAAPPHAGSALVAFHADAIAQIVGAGYVLHVLACRCKCTVVTLCGDGEFRLSLSDFTRHSWALYRRCPDLSQTDTPEA